MLICIKNRAILIISAMLIAAILNGCHRTFLPSIEEESRLLANAGFSQKRYAVFTFEQVDIGNYKVPPLLFTRHLLDKVDQILKETLDIETVVLDHGPESAWRKELRIQTELSFFSIKDHKRSGIDAFFHKRGFDGYIYLKLNADIGISPGKPFTENNYYNWDYQSEFKWDYQSVFKMVSLSEDGDYNNVMVVVDPAFRGHCAVDVRYDSLGRILADPEGFLADPEGCAEQIAAEFKQALNVRLNRN